MDKKSADLMMKIAPRIPLFRGLGQGMIEELINCGKLLTAEHGDVVIEETDKADSFYILLKGETSVEKRLGDDIINIAKLTGGECFGEMCLIEPMTNRSARIRAMMHCILIKFNLNALKHFPDLNAALTLNVAKILSRRLRSMNANLVSLSTEIHHKSEEGDEKPEEAIQSDADEKPVQAHDSSSELFMKTEHDLEKRH
jgi:CRP-like cAMP-binding protein